MLTYVDVLGPADLRRPPADIAVYYTAIKDPWR